MVLKGKGPTIYQFYIYICSYGHSKEMQKDALVKWQCVIANVSVEGKNSVRKLMLAHFFHVPGTVKMQGPIGP